jgi:hypothetical protein
VCKHCYEGQDLLGGPRMVALVSKGRLGGRRRAHFAHPPGMTPPGGRAHQALREVTRAQEAEARERSRPPERPPFDSVSRGRSTEHTGPDCWVYAAAAERDAAPPAAQQPVRNAGQEVTRANGYAETPPCSDCGYVYCQCGVAGARAAVRPGTRVAVYR